MTTRLATLLEDRASQELGKQLITHIEGEIKRLSEERDAAVLEFNQKIGEKTMALGELKTALSIVTQPPRKSSDLFYLDSKDIGGPGHFIEAVNLDPNRVTCSCKGFQFRQKCWASEHIKRNLSRSTPDLSWGYAFYDSSNLRFNDRVGREKEVVKRWEQRQQPRRGPYTGRILP